MSTDFEHTNKEARNKTITKFQGFSPVQLTLHHAITSAPTITRSVWGGQKGRKATSIKALHMDQLHASDSLLPLAKRCLCLVLGVQVVCHQTTDMMVQDPSVWAVLCGYDMRMILDE